eukprot:2275654-Prymnesium_polylepis.1
MVRAARARWNRMVAAHATPGRSERQSAETPEAPDGEAVARGLLRVEMWAMQGRRKCWKCWVDG